MWEYLSLASSTWKGRKEDLEAEHGYDPQVFNISTRQAEYKEMKLGKEFASFFSQP